MRPRQCGWRRISWRCGRRWSSARVRRTKKLSAISFQLTAWNLVEELYEGRQNQKFDRCGTGQPGARACRPALQAEVSAEHGPDGEPEEDSRTAQGHCARQDDTRRARAD